MPSIKALEGQIIRQLIIEDTSVAFRTDDHCYLMFHEQDCCEDVWLDDAKYIEKIVGQKIISAKEKEKYDSSEVGTGTWTFYDLETHDLHVQLVWRGVSNGYYSESITFCEISLKAYEKMSSKTKKNKKRKKGGK